MYGVHVVGLWEAANGNVDAQAMGAYPTTTPVSHVCMSPHSPQHMAAVLADGSVLLLVAALQADHALTVQVCAKEWSFHVICSAQAVPVLPAQAAQDPPLVEWMHHPTALWHAGTHSHLMSCQTSHTQLGRC